MKMDLKLKIFTLNCWGIVGISRHRKQRMEAIANHIATSNYDFVFLQEIWNQNDYHLICKRAADVLPYSYYFYSGVLGSGVCILSKSCIIDSSQSQYSMNGYAHKILHGDWYGGKVVGLCKVLHHGLKINLYVTHLHAEYDNLHDEYLPHRVCQAFEFGQFVRMTSETADLSIIAGDFNTEPTDLPYRLIIHNTGCIDSYLTQKNYKIIDGGTMKTCGHPENLYTSRSELKICPHGKRIDYIFYKCGAGTYVESLSCDTPLSKIPSSSIPYSDHEAVVAQLHVFKSAEAPKYQINPKARIEALYNSKTILEKNIKELQTSRYFYLFLSIIITALLLATMVIEFGIFGICIVFFQILATLALTFSLWMAFIVNRIEYSSLFSACRSIEILINALINEYNLKFPNEICETSTIL